SFSVQRSHTGSASDGSSSAGAGAPFDERIRSMASHGAAAGKQIEHLAGSVTATVSRTLSNAHRCMNSRIRHQNVTESAVKKVEGKEFFKQSERDTDTCERLRHYVASTISDPTWRRSAIPTSD